MRRVSLVVGSAALLLAACGGGAQEASDGGGESQPEAAATVEVATADVGDIVVDSEGMALYMFVPDQEGGEPTCYDDCAQTWPALEADGEPTAGDGLEQSLLGTVERTDGTTQVTYNDLPLYLYAGDEAAGDTNGQGISDVWWVLSPEGEPIEGTAAGGGGAGGGGGGAGGGGGTGY
jgi:predicted lipoprotein with Yx(FWY)xxD motif